MVASSVAWAGWELSGGDAEDTFYHDKTTIRKNGAIAKMWTMVDYSEVHTFKSDLSYQSSISLFVFNCKSGLGELISLLNYSGSMGTGKVIYNANWQEKDWEWKPIVPGTFNELHWKIACGKK